ncbi:endonuclease [Aliidongia dinghuensis]|uniref:Endonuclease n=1 Tax=Aliidongia dinghuensis TaxID=1867774 RepID=A0A8J2YZ30_9PROT|nr:S1/P1 nuclease [Aliidongia dinghuensis]GGF44257.1 endonuclease [Aliidongia dinghuensis]
MSKRMRTRGIAAALLLAGLMAAPTAKAWGVAGHAAIADIAEARLGSAALTQVNNLLALDLHQHLDEVASWADEYRGPHPETGPWHYVDIQIGDTTYDPARDCANDDCVIARTDAFVRVLADRSRPAEERLQALKFVVHFVGDLHQPLHAGENHDQGGNKIPVDYMGQTIAYGKYRMNLHSVWDTAVIERRLDVHEGPSAHGTDLRRAAAGLAEALSAEIRPQDARRWVKAPFAPAAWALDAHDLARDYAYRGILKPGEPSPTDAMMLGADYDTMAWAIVQLQLERAGVRLAAVLNRALK